MNHYLVIDRLEKIDNTKTSIESIGKIYQEEGRKGYHKELVQEWNKVFVAVKSDKKRMNLLNLAHEILHKCRVEKNLPFIDIFKRPLANCFRIIGREGQQELKNNSVKLLYLWEDRKLYDKAFLAQLTSMLDKPGKQVVNTEQELQKLKESLPQGLINPPPTLVSLVNNLKQSKRYAEKAKSDGPERGKCLQIQSRYFVLSMDNFKRAFVEADKRHLKMVLDLKSLAQKVQKMENFLRRPGP